MSNEQVVPLALQLVDMDVAAATMEDGEVITLLKPIRKPEDFNRLIVSTIRLVASASMLIAGSATGEIRREDTATGEILAFPATPEGMIRAILHGALESIREVRTGEAPVRTNDESGAVNQFVPPEGKRNVH